MNYNTNPAFPPERCPKPTGLRSMLSVSANRLKDKTLFKYFINKTDIGKISYTEFLSMTDCFGTALFALNLNKKRIAIISESRPEWVAAYIAVISAGGVIVPLDRELSSESVCDFAVLSEVDAVIYSPECETKLSVIKQNVGSKLKYIRFNDDVSFSWNGQLDSNDSLLQAEEIPFNLMLFMGRSMMAAGNISFISHCNDKDAMCAIIFTSGTTGTSKGVMLSENNLLSSVYASSNFSPYDEKTEMFSILPLHHTYETCCGILTPICVGMSVYFNNKLKNFMKNCKIFKPSGMVMVPLFAITIYKRIESELRKKKKEKIFSHAIKVTSFVKKLGIDLRRPVFAQVHASLGGKLKYIVCGGAAIPREYIERFEQLGIYIAEGYGITECAPLISVNPYNNLVTGSVGCGTYEGTVKVKAEVNGVYGELPCGEIGEICYKGPNVMLGYYKNPEATAESFDSDGYFKTGDLGYIDEKGYIFITGRKKNVIILANGKNVYPEEIEEYLLKTEFIKEALAVTRINNEGDPVLTALVYPDYQILGSNDAEVSEAVKAAITALNKKLPSFKQIKNIEIRKTEFEKSTTKKILRYKYI